MKYDLISPRSKDELLSEIKTRQGTPFRFVAGNTDLLLEIKKSKPTDLSLINLGLLDLPEMRSIQIENNGLRIGSLVTAAQLVDHDELGKRLPLLKKAAHSVASPQIREVATLGGNLCTASPAGDMSCALVALEAVIEILSDSGDLRTLPIGDFFHGVRKTDLKENEVLYSIWIPTQKIEGRIVSDFVKIGIRKSMEISIVALAYQFQLDSSGNIQKSGLALGSVAAVIPFAKSACQCLEGKNFNSIDEDTKQEFLGKVMEYAAPISDVRASAWYRTQVLSNITKAIFE
ncbi:MAG: hypothetical protein GY786_25090 [Proteobacteria bacterium]|nr:hypothetical protein [Pseudomonadota bacterium]